MPVAGFGSTAILARQLKKIPAILRFSTVVAGAPKWVGSARTAGGPDHQYFVGGRLKSGAWST